MTAVRRKVHDILRSFKNIAGIRWYNLEEFIGIIYRNFYYELKGVG